MFPGNYLTCMEVIGQNQVQRLMITVVNVYFSAPGPLSIHPPSVNIFKHLLLGNLKVKFHIGTPDNSGTGHTEFYTNDDPRLTLTSLTPRSNLPPIAFKWGKMEKFDFLKVTLLT